MPAFGSATAVLVGCMVLVGWILDSATLKSVVPGLVTMKANTALAFILAGASLWLLRAERIPPRARRSARAGAGLVVAIGALTLSEYLGGWDWHIDQLLFTEPPEADGTNAPGRMGLNTALSFLGLGVALLLLDVKVPGSHWLTQTLAVTVALFSLFAVLATPSTWSSCTQFRPSHRWRCTRQSRSQGSASVSCLRAGSGGS